MHNVMQRKDYPLFKIPITYGSSINNVVLRTSSYETINKNSYLIPKPQVYAVQPFLDIPH